MKTHIKSLAIIILVILSIIGVAYFVNAGFPPTKVIIVSPIGYNSKRNISVTFHFVLNDSSKNVTSYKIFLVNGNQSNSTLYAVKWDNIENTNEKSNVTVSNCNNGSIQIKDRAKVLLVVQVGVKDNSSGNYIYYANSSVSTFYMRSQPGFNVSSKFPRLPKNNVWQTMRNLTIQFGVKNKEDAYCQLWTNQTGSWIPESGTVWLVKNNTFVGNASQVTPFKQTYTFIKDGTFKWAVQCWDKDVLPDPSQELLVTSNFSVNYTVKIDSLYPVFTLNKICYQNLTGCIVPSEDTASYIKMNSQWGRLLFNLTVNETNLKNCTIFGINASTDNASKNPWYYNKTTNLTKGYFFNFSNINASDSISRRHNYNIMCEDLSRHKTWLSTAKNWTLYTDARTPRVQQIYIRKQDTGYCNKFIVNFTTSEGSNATVFYSLNGVGTSARKVSDSTTNQTSHILYIPFNYSFPTNQWGVEKPFYINITTCDLAGNCGNATQVKTFTPVPLCAGWSSYGLLSTKENATLSRIANQSKSEYVFYFRNFNQSWKYYDRISNVGSATWNLSILDAVWFYNSEDQLWDRQFNATTSIRDNRNLKIIANLTWNKDSFKSTNITRGSNYINWLANNQSYTLQHIALYFNNSATWNINPKNVTYFAWFNNTNKKFVSYIWNVSWRNSTVVPFGNTVWVASDKNYTWKGYCNATVKFVNKYSRSYNDTDGAAYFLGASCHH